MNNLKHLFENNIAWANAMKKNNPEFFSSLADHQAPEYLWIGCSDSRVPSCQITNLPPGEVFVHRNIANVVSDTDLNCLSVIQYAVDALKVKHIIVCGHYGCGGVKAAMHGVDYDFVEEWVKNIKNVVKTNAADLENLTEDEKHNRLCELNVQQQVLNISNTDTVKNAWRNKQDLTIHGWLYNLRDGMLKDLNFSINSAK